MKRISLLGSIIILFVIMFCIYIQNRNEYSRSDIVGDSIIMKPPYANKEIVFSEQPRMSLFGIGLAGPPDYIFCRFNELPFCDLDTPIVIADRSLRIYSRVITVCDVPFGMNIIYNTNTNPVEVQYIDFVSSHSDDREIYRVVDKLTEYYGEPILEEPMHFTWRNQFDGSMIKGRYVRGSTNPDDEGGWRFYIFKWQVKL